MTKLTLYHGNALKILPTLPSESVDLVLTDPPYNVSNGTVINRSYKHYVWRRPSSIKFDFGDWDKYEDAEFYDFTRAWFEEVSRILKDGGWFATFFSKERVGWFVDPIFGMFKDYGFKVRTVITWHKTNPTPSFRKVNFISSTEFIVVGSKGSSKIPNFLMQKEMHNFFETTNSSTYGETKHPTEKPLSLITWLMHILSKEGDTVLDPFLGSGTTMLAGLRLGRNVIGIEKESEYIKIIKDRLNWGSSLGDVEFESMRGVMPNDNLPRRINHN